MEWVSCLLNDKYEQEADRVSEQVMRMPDSALQRQTDEEKQDDVIQAKRVEKTSTSTKYVQLPSLNNGHSLPKATQQFFSSRMDYDFSHVSVHSDTQAAQSASDLNARAYTYGNNVVFNKGEYTPDSHAGKKLLAHELTHVIQQNGGRHGGSLIQRYSHTNDCPESFLIKYVWPGHDLAKNEIRVLTPFL